MYLAGSATAAPGPSAPEYWSDAQGVNAAACHPHIAEQQLDHAIVRMFCAPTECCVQPRAYRTRQFYREHWFLRCIRRLSGRVFWRTTDVFNHIWRVAGNVCFSKFHTQRGCCSVVSRLASRFRPVHKSRRIYRTCVFPRVAGEQAIFKAVILTHDQAGVV